MHLNHWCMYYENGRDRNISGDRYPEIISSALAGCCVFLMLVSKHSLASAEVRKELTMVTEGAKKDKFKNFKSYLSFLTTSITTITRPCVLKDNINHPSYLSGIAVIAESHIAMHYNMQTKEVLMDIFSCKTVDEDKYQEVMSQMFGEYKDVLILRGRKNEQRKDSQLNKHENHKHWQDVII